MPDIRPYPITVERDDDDGYIVADEVTLVYGWGETLAEAMADYDASLAEWRAITEDRGGRATARTALR